MVQNLTWGAGYNVAAIPLAAGVFAVAGVTLSPDRHTAPSDHSVGPRHTTTNAMIDHLPHHAGSRPATAPRWRTVTSVLGLVLGVFVMHGVNHPSASHAGLLGFTTTASTAHTDTTAHSTEMHCPDGSCSHSETSAMLMAACTFAVLASGSTASRRCRPYQPARATVLPWPTGPAWGPEPPVPRFV